MLRVTKHQFVGDSNPTITACFQAPWLIMTAGHMMRPLSHVLVLKLQSAPYLNLVFQPVDRGEFALMQAGCLGIDGGISSQAASSYSLFFYLSLLESVFRLEVVLWIGAITKQAYRTGREGSKVEIWTLSSNYGKRVKEAFLPLNGLQVIKFLLMKNYDCKESMANMTRPTSNR